MSVTHAQKEISLSPKEYALLELVMRNPKRIFSRSAVIDKLWTANEAPAESTVTNLVKDLRRKLKNAGIPHAPLETLHGSGYRLKLPPEIPLALTPNPPLDSAPAQGVQPRPTATPPLTGR
jgi:DNA-binding response OmpR family regulator